MSELDEKRSRLGKIKEESKRKRVVGRYAGTAKLADGVAEWRQAVPGEYYIARQEARGYTGRRSSGSENPYNDEKSKASAAQFAVVKGYDPETIDRMAIQEKNNSNSAYRSMAEKSHA